MSNCNGCSGVSGHCHGCDNCACDKGGCDRPLDNYTPKLSGKHVKETPIEDYLKPKPKPHQDATPLGEKCTCNPPVRWAKRYQCWNCVKSYCYAVGLDGAEQAAIDYSFSAVAHDWLIEMIKELKK